MLRSVALTTLLISSASAAIWPEYLGKYERKSVTPVDISTDDRAQWDEYGIQEVEAADYGSFKVTASRFKDSTGAYAASLEPPPGKMQVGNYLVFCSGSCPKDLARLADALPRVSHAPVPILGAYLPRKDLVPRSERYVLGPLGLGRNTPQVPASAVAFQFGTEGQVGRYRTPQGEDTLAIFYYPTQQMARQQAGEFEKLPGASVKRTGPLVAVVFGAADPKVAERLLSNINYQASVSWTEPLPVVVRPQSVGQMIAAILTLAGIVVLFCVMSGLVFGAVRVLTKKFGHSGAGEPMIVLHLGDK